MKIDPTDESILRAAQTGDGLIPITSGEQLRALAEAAKARHDGFLTLAAELMTAERTAFVRRLRVDDGYSWRAVATACYDEWIGEREHDEWYPPSNQLMGMALCEAAATAYGEDHMSEPWN
jgi:hypothetical protein